MVAFVAVWQDWFGRAQLVKFGNGTSGQAMLISSALVFVPLVKARLVTARKGRGAICAPYS
jgi:hypothetical protein